MLKPKNLIRNVLIAISTLSLILAAVSLYVFYSWNHNQKIISSLSISLPNYYEQKMNHLHAKAKNATDNKEKIKTYRKISNKLKTTTNLYNYYNLKNEANTFISKTLINEGKIEEALEFTENWLNSNTYDFKPKFIYASLLKKTNIQKALSFYQELYKNYGDILTISSKYVSLLLDIGDFQKALDIAQAEKHHIQDSPNVNFRIYYIDSINKIFSATSIFLVKDFVKTNDEYLLTIEKQFDGLKGLRLDVDGLPISSRIRNFTFNLISKKPAFKQLFIKSLHHLEKEGKDLIVTGNDPFFVLSLPEVSIGLSEKVKFEAKLEIEKKINYSINKIFYHNRWRIYYSKSKKHNKENSKSFRFRSDSDTFNLQTAISIPAQKYSFFRVNFPSIKNFTFNSLNIEINNSFNISASSFLNLHDLKKTKDGSFIVTGKTPYIEFESDFDEVINSLSIRLILGENS